MEKIKQYLIKNWKNIAFIAIIAILILFNVRQYRANMTIYQDNTKINTEYAALKEKTVIYEKQVAVYQSAIDKKNTEIDSSKTIINQTEANLATSQSKVKDLSKKLLSKGTIRPEDIQDYSDDCDSLARIAPVLSDQVDTLKSQNKSLITTMTNKSELQDSIIKIKDIQISDNSKLLDKTVTAYNTSVAKLTTIETKLVKEQKRKSTWKKIAIGLGAVVTGIIAIK